ncbi:MAG: hypothetical protein WCA76_13250, partial [Candidatus Sulfotelmatobacter sp.]
GIGRGCHAEDHDRPSLVDSDAADVYDDPFIHLSQESENRRATPAIVHGTSTARSRAGTGGVAASLP